MKMKYGEEYKLNILGELTFADDITCIPDNEFMDNPYISQIKFGPNIKLIGKGCFSNCSNLKSIEFGNAEISIIPESCFENCSSLKTIDVWPESLVCIKDRAFAHNYSLNSLPRFPKGFRRFEKNSFAQDPFFEISFSSDVFDMDDIDDISLYCKTLNINDKEYLISDWDMDSVIPLRHDETAEFEAWKAKTLSSFFSKSAQKYLYKYLDKKSGEFTLSYSLRTAKEELDARVYNNLRQRAKAENWSLETELSISEYSTISHSCFIGVCDWAVQNGYDISKKYPIREYLLHNDENERGNLFVDFVQKYVKG